MTKLELTMALLPVVFMIHEYEEIIMFKHWLKHHQPELRTRFPKFEQMLARSGHFNYATSTYAVGTAHEFLLISLITFSAMSVGAYSWWFAAFAGHSIHLLIHLVQWMIYRKYIPVIVTTILSLPYCVYALALFAKASLLTPLQMLLWAVTGIALTALSLCSAFLLMNRFQRWKNKHCAKTSTTSNRKA